MKKPTKLHISLRQSSSIQGWQVKKGQGQSHSFWFEVKFTFVLVSISMDATQKHPTATVHSLGKCQLLNSWLTKSRLKSGVLKSNRRGQLWWIINKLEQPHHTTRLLCYKIKSKIPFYKQRTFFFYFSFLVVLSLVDHLIYHQRWFHWHFTE